jgi:ABC-type branched-subunit amino acid transport system substrate-binding protein
LFDHKVKFVAGGVMPFTIIAANSVLGPAKVLFATNYNCATPQEYGPTTPYQFVTTNATVEGMASMLEYVAQARPEVKTIAVILPEDGSAAILFPMIIQMAKARGMTVSGDAITFAMDAVDFTPIAKKAMGRNPDAIFMGNGWPSMQGSILKTARQSGYTKLIFQTNYAAADAILKVAGPEASTNFFLHSVTPGERTNPPLMEEVFRRTKAKYGHEEIMFTHKGFDNIYILAQAIEAAQSLDPTDVKNKWEKMDKIVGSTGTGRMCGQKTYGINHSVCLPDPIAGLVNGQVKHLKWMNVIMTP